MPASVAHANAGGVTGASAGSNPCSACHSGGTYGASLALSGGATTVAPSSVTEFELLLTSGGAPAGGFDLSATGGTLGVSSSANGAGVQSASGELTHTAPKAADGSGNIRWAFTWTAPASSGTYAFNACAEPVDGDGTEAGDGADACMTSTVTVQSANAAPTAANDAYSTKTGTALQKAAPGVLANDSDPDNDPLTAQLVTDVAHGTLTLNADGSFTYTPATGFQGQDTFTYRASDGAATSAAATVTLTVMGGAPVAGDDSYTTKFGTVLHKAAPGVLENDNDPDNDPLTAQLDSDVSHGALTLNADGSFTYTPASGFEGQDTFKYRASDGTSTSSAATVTITVISDTAPHAVSDSYSTPFGTTLSVSAPGVLANDSDADGDPITAQLVTDVAHGTLTLNANGSFRYAPASGFGGSDSFTYRASDGAKTSSSVSVQLTVATNTAPLAAPDSYSTTENAPLDVVAPGVLRNDTDANGDTLHAVKVTEPAHGTLSLHADGSFTYTPASGYHGPDSFTYQASDGFDNSGVATVNLDVSNGSGAQRSGTAPSGNGAPGPMLILVFVLAGLARRINRL